MPIQDPYVFGTRGTGITYRKKLWYLTMEGKNNREMKILGLESNLYVPINPNGWIRISNRGPRIRIRILPTVFMKCH